MVYPTSSSQFFAQGTIHTLQQTFSNAVRSGDFVAALNIFVSADEHERKNIADIGDVLVRHLRFDDHHDTALILKCVALAKENGLIDSKIASDLLYQTTCRPLPDLTKWLILHAPIEQWAADAALKTYAAANNREIVSLLCNFCSEKGRQHAAIAAVKGNALDSILEMLNQRAISGIYEHPMTSMLDHCLGTPLTESIWEVLIRTAHQANAFAIAEALAIWKPSLLSMTDLCVLGQVEARNGRLAPVEEVLRALPSASISNSEQRVASRQYWLQFSVKKIWRTAKEHAQVKAVIHQYFPPQK